MRNFLERMRYALSRFMAGRYGGRDLLNMILLGTAVALNIASLVFSWCRLPIPFWICYAVSGVVLILAIFRMFSRNVQARYNENRKLLNFFTRLRMRKDYHIYKCPSCRQKIRIPRKGGKRVEIRCPKCGEKFIKKI